MNHGHDVLRLIVCMLIMVSRTLAQPVHVATSGANQDIEQDFAAGERITLPISVFALGGEGVFGAEAAARHYYRKGAMRLSQWVAARLAVMLPSPKAGRRCVTRPSAGLRRDCVPPRQ